MHPKTQELIQNTILIDEMAEEKFRSKQAKFLHPLLRDETKIHSQALKYALAGFVGTKTNITIDGMVMAVTGTDRIEHLMPVFTVIIKEQPRAVFQFACRIFPLMSFIETSIEGIQFYDEEVEDKFRAILNRYDPSESIQQRLALRVVDFMMDSGYEFKNMFAMNKPKEGIMGITIQLVSKIKNDYEFADISVVLTNLD